MAEFTVGPAAAAINIGLIFLQLTLPLLQALLLVGFTPPQNTAVTWSVISRFIQSTLWPSILSCDTAAGRKDGVQVCVWLWTYLATVTTTLVIIAGIITPIGLGEKIIAGSLVTARFEYAADRSVFGSETLPRDTYAPAYLRWNGFLPCFGIDASDPPKHYCDDYGLGNTDKTAQDAYNLPDVTGCCVNDAKKTGDFGPSPFEIQFRQYQYQCRSTEQELHDRPYGTGLLAMVESLILSSSVVVREGIIADFVNGGVGFRNHTVPTGPRIKYGAEWSEDILWLEPMTACVDTKWSLEHRPLAWPVSTLYALSPKNIWLTKDGDVESSPFLPTRWLQLPGVFDPRLRERAQLTASIFNDRFSELLNANGQNATFSPKDHIKDWSILDALGFYSGVSNLKGLRLGALTDPENGLIRFQSPHLQSQSRSNISLESALKACQGVPLYSGNGVDTLLQVKCGYMLTPPDYSSRKGYISQSLYTCSSTIRATIKEISFQYRPVSKDVSLDDLIVTSVSPKSYDSSARKPVWVVGRPHYCSNFPRVPENLSDDEIVTVRSETLYIPARDEVTPRCGYGCDGNFSLAILNAPGVLLSKAYETSEDRSYYDLDYDYSAVRNRRMLAKFRELSASPERAATIPNLIWTDLAANVLVGAKSPLSSFYVDKSYQVRANRRKMFFHYTWAIPALFCAAIWIFLAVACLVLYLTPRSRYRVRLPMLKDYTNRLSVGRALVAVSRFNAVKLHGSTKGWLATDGRRRIDLFPVIGGADYGMEMEDLPTRLRRASV